MQICQLPGCRLDLVCLAYSTMQRWRVRVFALVSNEIYLYYQVVRAFQSCNNIYLLRQPRISSLCTRVVFIPWNRNPIEYIIEFYINRYIFLISNFLRVLYRIMIIIDNKICFYTTHLQHLVIINRSVINRKIFFFNVEL